MGNYSKFIKATGNCRIMISKIRKYLQDFPDVFPVFLKDIEEDCMIFQDENGEDYTRLKDIGNFMNEWKLYGYLDFNYIRDFYVLYEAMSMNEMPCYESKIKVCEKVSSCRYHSIGSLARSGIRAREGMQVTKTKGHLQDTDFETIGELKSLLIPFIDNPMANEPIMKISTKGLHDISLITTSSEIQNEESQDRKKRKIQANIDEPCKLYFVEEDHHYFYLEFLPYGEGIKIAVVDNYPTVEEICETWDKRLMKLFSQTRDEAFSWSILTLE